ncbi:hypothetical protein CMQ_6008 [Grosmannia clavigera kw1407]|uniref:Ribonucleases P/MRP subunit Pop8-like domain-containing protein n=1 Tax=Grosmannia clavigera (strain kw1407 / UAMH 11150) TaxID=655863 RepID=F0XLT4_GROCL|nr:uncharacterized protein CMQ_6008 [Grosmannia clavigera kw1407]EFX01066.1 hypothetical protein CMQ_6008 [Grosmannia clavigera kw1407]
MASEEHQEDASMEDTPLAASIEAATRNRGKKQGKTRELYSCTISKPPFAYVHIEAATSRQTDTVGSVIDPLQIRSYCTAALKQFVGATGAGMPLDLLKIDGRQFWIRLPREDLSFFAAALAAWSFTDQDGVTTVLRLLASGNWLGSLLGRTRLPQLWET